MIYSLIKNRNSHLNIVTWLFEIFPNLCCFKNRGEVCSAFQMICLTGNLEMVQMIFKTQSEHISDISELSSIAFSNACCSGNMELITWLYEKIAKDRDFMDVW